MLFPKSYGFQSCSDFSEERNTKPEWLILQPGWNGEDGFFVPVSGSGPGFLLHKNEKWNCIPDKFIDGYDIERYNGSVHAQLQGTIVTGI